MDWYSQIRAAENADHPALAIELTKRAVADAPFDFRTTMMYGMALQSVARYAEADRAFQAAQDIATYEQKVLVYRQRGLLEQDRANVAAAEEWFALSIAAKPDDATGYIYLGAMLAKLGQLERAELTHRRATQCSEGVIDEAYLNLGFVLRARAQYVAALACFRQAANMDPTDVAASTAIADIEQVLLLAGDV